MMRLRPHWLDRVQLPKPLRFEQKTMKLKTLDLFSLLLFLLLFFSFLFFLLFLLFSFFPLFLPVSSSFLFLGLWNVLCPLFVFLFLFSQLSYFRKRKYTHPHISLYVS